MEIIRSYVQRAEAARDILFSLTEEQRGVIQSLLGEVNAIQKYATEKTTELGGISECDTCKGECCSRSIGPFVFSEINFFVAFTEMREGGVEKVIKALTEDGDISRCRLSSENGCILPINARPPYCKTYFCYKIPKLEEKLGKLLYPIESRYTSIENKLKEMGYDLYNGGSKLPILAVDRR